MPGLLRRPTRRSAAVLAAVSGLTTLVLQVPIARLQKTHSARVENVTVSFTDGAEPTDVTLPFVLENGYKHEKYWYEGTLVWPDPPPSRVRIIPDDCLERLSLNGGEIPIDHLPWSIRCTYAHGFTLNLKPYLRPGANKITFRVWNKGGPTGLDFLGPPDHPEYLAWVGAAGISSMITLGAGLVAAAVPLMPAAVIASSFALQLTYARPSHYRDRSYDVHGHLHYVEVMGTEWRVPRADEGWQFHHPPLYYAIGAVIYATGRALGLRDPFVPLQMFGVLIATAFLIAAWFALEAVLPSARLATLALVPVAFWPSHLLRGPTVTNDGLANFLALASFAALGRFLRSGSRASWRWACALAGLALLTKGTGIIAFSVLGIALLVPQARTRWKTLLPDLAMIGVASLGGLIAILAAKGTFITNAAGLPDELLLENTVAHFIALEPFDFLAHPFTDPREDEGGRQFFWNFLFKTSLWGEFKLTDHPSWIWVARAANGGLLALLALAAWAGIAWARAGLRSRASDLFGRAETWLLVLAGTAVGWVAAYRLAYPYSPTEDFRFIPQVSVALGGLAVLAGARAWRSPGPWAHAGASQGLRRMGVFAGAAGAALMLVCGNALLLAAAYEVVRKLEHVQ